MSKEGGFGRVARIVLDDRPPTGGASVCDDDALVQFEHLDAQVLLCTESAVSGRGDGVITIVGKARNSEAEPWRKARRQVSVSDFDFGAALASISQGFFVRRAGQPADTLAAPTKNSDAGRSEISPERAVSEPQPHVGLTVNLLQAVDGVFFGAAEFGLDGPLAVVIRGGSSTSGGPLITSASA
jgi:hypothetical protein